MTFRERIRLYCLERGLLDSVASEVAVQSVADGPIADRLDDDIESYPKGMVDSVLTAVNDRVIEWIDDHNPRAWYRRLFIPALH